jgi:hypothetical protein
LLNELATAEESRAGVDANRVDSSLASGARSIDQTASWLVAMNIPFLVPIASR